MNNTSIVAMSLVATSSPTIHSYNHSLHTWFWIIALIEAVVIVIGNGIVIYLVTTQRRLRKTGNWFVLSLAIADFLVGSFIIPTHFVCSQLVTKCFWKVQLLIYELLLFVSIGNLCAMTLDRYIAILHPLRYHIVMTTTRAWTAIGLAWAIPGMTSLVPAFWRFKTTGGEKLEKLYRSFVILAFVLVPVAVLLLVYVRILTIIRRHIRQCAVVQAQLNFNIQHKSTDYRSSNIKSSAKVMGAMILLFIICWGLSAYRSLCFYFNLCNSSHLIDKLSRLLLFLNSAGNPIVYSLLKKDLRKSLLQILRSIRCLK